MLSVFQNLVTEWTYTAGRPYGDPSRDVELDVLITDPEGSERRVPAFWAGEHTWGVRFASHVVGVHRFRTVCSDPGSDLHGREGAIEVVPYEGDNPLARHGPLRVAADRRHLEHADGTPFFWLGDTWWMALSRRLAWPDEFHTLVADRAGKSFSVIQIVAGLYPDMDGFDPRGANEAGFPWASGYARINPRYFDQADLRIAYLVRSGLVPCIVGSWGYYMDRAGEDVLRQHWRNLVARYAAYPVVWCVAGEALMGYYTDPEHWQPSEERLALLRRRWSELARHIRRLDGFGRPITIHPTRLGRDQVDDPFVLDLEMLQTGHSGHGTLGSTVDMLTSSLAREPMMPVLVGEVNYEGILGTAWEDMQRFQFWACMLSGAAGHTYGANGLWQLNRPDMPYGSSPHGASWGGPSWQEAMRLPGSAQLGIGRRLLERYPWQRFEVHPEWVEPRQTPECRVAPYAAGIPGQVRIIYYPVESAWAASGGQMRVLGLEEGAAYRAAYVDPITGREYDLGPVRAHPQGSYTVPRPPVVHDWLLVLENAGSS